MTTASMASVRPTQVGLFTLLHFPAVYVVDAILFVVQLFALALAWGWLMQKTDSIWGSVLFHTGADCIIIFSFFKMLGAA